MLQQNTLTGAFFIIGIGIGSPITLLGACIATLAGLLYAKLRKYDAEEIYRGLYGYNAALVGCAIYFFTKPTLLSTIAVIVAGVLSTVIMHFMLQKTRRVLAFTAPFIITIWLTLLLFKFGGIDITPVPFTGNIGNEFNIVMRGVAQVMFQVSWLAGLVFFADYYVVLSESPLGFYLPRY